MGIDYYHDTVISSVEGKNLYRLSCAPITYFMFEILELLEVGETIAAGEIIAECGTENFLFSLSLPFAVKIVRINQELLDYTQKYEGQDFPKYGGFSQTDWIVEVEKIQYSEDENPFYSQKRESPFEQTWHRQKNSPLELSVGFQLENYCARGLYFKHFQLLGSSFKRGELMATFDYCPNFLFLRYKHQNDVFLPQLLEKHKKIAHLYAPCDIESVAVSSIFEYEVYSHTEWAFLHGKRQALLEIKRKLQAYKDPNYNLWYQQEGEYIRIGLETRGHEYLEVHTYLPSDFAPVGQTLHKDEHFFTFVVNGPYDPRVAAPFDMKIISQNPKNEAYHINAKSAIAEKFLGENSFSKANFYKESWLFLVIPLYPEKVRDYLADLLNKGSFD